MTPRKDTLFEMFAGPAPTHTKAQPGSDCPGILGFVGYCFGPTLRPVECPLYQCSECLQLLYDEPASREDRKHRRPPRHPRRIVATAKLERVKGD